MSKLTLILFLTAPFIYSQSVDIPIAAIAKDHYEFIEKISEDKICDYYGSRKHVNRGEEVLICGIKECIGKGNVAKKYFEVCINGKLYYAEKEWLKTEDLLYEAIEKMSKFESFRLRIQTIKHNTEELEKEIASVDSFLNSCSLLGIMLLRTSLVYPNEFTETAAFEIELFNPTKKEIKNIWVTFNGLDLKQNKVGTLKHPNGVITTQAEVVLKPYEIKTLTLEAGLRGAITAQVSQIKIQYTDNTTKVISDVSKVTPSKDIRRTIYTSYYN